MNRFPTELANVALSPAECAEQGGVALYKVTADFPYLSDAFGQITVPAGLITDFASIPRAALWYVKDDDPCILYPSVVHDWLYTMRGVLPGRAALTRAECDAVLREAMIYCGARADQSATVYAAVRMFGGRHWA